MDINESPLLPLPTAEDKDPETKSKDDDNIIRIIPYNTTIPDSRIVRVEIVKAVINKKKNLNNLPLKTDISKSKYSKSKK